MPIINLALLETLNQLDRLEDLSAEDLSDLKERVFHDTLFNSLSSVQRFLKDELDFSTDIHTERLSLQKERGHTWLCQRAPIPQGLWGIKETLHSVVCYLNTKGLITLKHTMSNKRSVGQKNLSEIFNPSNLSNITLDPFRTQVPLSVIIEEETDYQRLKFLRYYLMKGALNLIQSDFETFIQAQSKAFQEKRRTKIAGTYLGHLKESLLSGSDRREGSLGYKNYPVIFFQYVRYCEVENDWHLLLDSFYDNAKAHSEEIDIDENEDPTRSNDYTCFAGAAERVCLVCDGLSRSLNEEVLTIYRRYAIALEDLFKGSLEESNQFYKSLLLASYYGQYSVKEKESVAVSSSFMANEHPMTEEIYALLSTHTPLLAKKIIKKRQRLFVDSLGLKDVLSLLVESDLTLPEGLENQLLENEFFVVNYKERGWVNKINPDFFRKNVHANELLLMEILEPYEHDLRKALLKDRLKTVLGFERSSKLVLQAAVNEEICLPALLEKRLLDLGILEKIVIPDLDIDPDEERDIANFAELIDALSEESELPQSLLLLALFEQAYHRQRVEDQSWTDYIVSSSQSIACKARHEKKGYQSLISCSEISTYGLSALSENHIIEMEEQIVNQWCHQSNLNIRLNLPTLALVNKERLTQLKKIYLRLDSLEYDDLNSSDILDYCDGDILEALYIDNELPSDQLNDLLVKSIDRPHTGLIGVILKTENEDFSFQINDIFELARDAFHVDKKELALFLLTEFSKIRYGTKENLLCAHIRRKQIHVAELLLELGCIPDPIDFDDKTALGIALDVKSIAGVKALLKHGADPDIKSADDYPVHLAAQHTSKQLMCLLDLFQADLNVEDDNGNTPLMIAIKDHNTQVIDFLLERKVKLDHRNLDGENVLTLALKAGLDYYATEFYRQGVKLKEKRYAKQESLTVFYAIENGCKDFINILIEQGYDFSHVNDNGHSSLVVAILNNQLEIASSFIQAGIDLDQYHGCINTPVMAAFTIGEFGVLRQLVDKHVDLNIVRQDGHTLLTLAIESESKDVVDICLKHQEHSRKTLRRGQKNPLMLGIKIDNPGIVDSLLKKIDLDDYSQINLVLYALENDAVYSLFCLLEAGHALDLNNAHQSCCFKVMISNDPVRFFLVMKESIPELSDQLVLALVEFFRPYNTFLDQDDQLYLACITGDQSLLTADLQAMMISHESNLLNLAQRFKQDNIYNFLSKKIDEIKRTDKKRSLTESLESSIPLWPTGLNLSSTSKKQKNQSKPSMSNA